MSDASQTPADAAVLAEAHRRTRRSFLAAGAGVLATGGLYAYLNLEPEVDTQPGLLRKAFRANADLSRTLFREHALAPTYPLARAETLRVNGVYGLKQALLPDSYRLQVVGVHNASRHPRFAPDVTAWQYRYEATRSKEDEGHDTKVDPAKAKPAPQETSSTATKMAPADKQAHAKIDESMHDDDNLGRKPRGMEEAGESDSTLPAGTPGLLLSLDDITSFPRHELVTQFKCIEGWSQVVHWAGIRMADFLDAYPPAPIEGAEPKFAYMETPDGDYYVGYDLHVLRHPQTLLVTEMMGRPLTQFHGAPLRLHTPLKYGYKQIKRIGLIAYTNDKPDDYWTKLGYDWYAGL